MRRFALIATVSALALTACTDKAKVETIVKDYLMAHPEVIRDAMLELQKKEQAGHLEQFSKAIADSQDALLNDPRDLSIGPKNAKVTVVEFYDYRCGYCHAAAPAVAEMVAKNPDMRFVFKDLPVLGGPDSPSHMMALAASAAVKQGHDKTFAFHKGLMTADVASDAQVYEIAKKAGLDVEALKAEMKNPAHEARFKETMELASKLGIQGTPGFIIGNAMIPGWAPEQIAAAIEMAKKK